MDNPIAIIKRNIPIWMKMKIWDFLLQLDANKNASIRAAFSAQEAKDIKTIPIFIISFNRLSYLKKIVDMLESKGYFNINIIDNCSTYPPLLSYYENIPYPVIRMKDNLGHMAFWKSSLFDEYRDSFYVVTDPDVIPIEECPDDFMQVFFTYLKKYPFLRKVGFSLKLDDLPKDGVLAQEAITWEQQFYKDKIGNLPAYYAGIDTTFALYAPDKFYKDKDFLRGLRMAYPYEARHLPWYKTKDDVSEEDVYYSAHKTNGWWDIVKGEVTPDGTDIKIERKNKTCTPPLD